MTDNANRVTDAWNYSLFDSILQRRARRFPVGAAIPGDVSPFASPNPPYPLDDIEEALLVLAGIGMTGLALSDLPFTDENGPTQGNTIFHFTGRTYPSACSSHGTELFVSNDDGTFFVDVGGRSVAPPDDASPGGEATPKDEDTILRTYRESLVRLSDSRLDMPMRSPVMSAINQWNVNRPGTTLFIPVTDVTREYINLAMTLLSPPDNAYIYDDLNGNAEPLSGFVDSGHMSREKAFSLSDFERLVAVKTVGVEHAFICQNMYLPVQAMGLGGWAFGTGDARVAFGGTDEAKGLKFLHADAPSRGLSGGTQRVPVGLPGHFESYRPPFYNSMSEAVQAVYDEKFGESGSYQGQTSYKNGIPSDAVPPTPAWVVDAVKQLCEYIWEQYGSFPGTMDPVQMNLWFQAHHLETEYYDKHHASPAYPESVGQHFAIWH